MEKGTVKRRIFLSNALMVLVTLLTFLNMNPNIVFFREKLFEKNIGI